MWNGVQASRCLKITTVSAYTFRLYPTLSSSSLLTRDGLLYFHVHLVLSINF